MKLRSVKDLYLVKKIILTTMASEDEEARDKAIQLINKVLLHEGGARAVLYPYNGLKDEILQLWGEHMAPKDIAAKLGMDEDSEEVVLCVIADSKKEC